MWSWAERTCQDGLPQAGGLILPGPALLRRAVLNRCLHSMAISYKSISPWPIFFQERKMLSTVKSKSSLNFLLLISTILMLPNILNAQRTQKPVLHAKHWV